MKRFVFAMLTSCASLVLLGCPRKTPVAAAPPPPSVSTDSKPLIVSPGAMTGHLLHPVSPIYPAEAKARHLEGTVLLRCVITKTGRIANLRVVHSSDPIFTDAAITAVQDWEYKPYMLNGEPVAVDTTITVNFRM